MSLSVNIIDSPEINRLRIQNFLTFEIRQSSNTKLEIYRNGLDDTVPHLTISFGNISREIDIHLTKRNKGDLTDYKSIAKINEKDIAEVFSSAEKTFERIVFENLKTIKKIRPGWMARKGYAVFYLDDNAEQQFMNRIAPKKKRKSKWERFLGETVNESITHRELLNNFFCPSILHELAEKDYKNPLFAVRFYGKHKPQVMPVGLFKVSKEKYCWIRLDKFAEAIKYPIEHYLISCFKQLLPENAWKTIESEMRLEELE